jgi:hypothetical protein
LQNEPKVTQYIIIFYILKYKLSLSTPLNTDIIYTSAHVQSPLTSHFNTTSI